MKILDSKRQNVDAIMRDDQCLRQDVYLKALRKHLEGVYKQLRDKDKNWQLSTLSHILSERIRMMRCHMCVEGSYVVDTMC